jgi:hypothetical protein
MTAFFRRWPDDSDQRHRHITSPREFPLIVNDSENESLRLPPTDAFPRLSPPQPPSLHRLTLGKITVYELFLNR